MKLKIPKYTFSLIEKEFSNEFVVKIFNGKYKIYHYSVKNHMVEGEEICYYISNIIIPNES